MPYLRDRAIVLKNMPFREQDAWVTLYGRTHGKMVAAARGMRRMGAKHMGHLQPCAEIEVMIAKGAAFDKIAVAKVSHPRLEIRKKLVSASLVGAFSDLVDRLTRPGVGDTAIYDLLCDVLRLAEHLPETASASRVQMLWGAAALKLLDMSGYAPTLDGMDRTDIFLRFLRHKPLDEALKVTAQREFFSTIVQKIGHALERAPLTSAPHGPLTIAAMLA